jgi:uncharacterized protein YdeI (YjbR/CyaY-like superfamily)
VSPNRDPRIDSYIKASAPFAQPILKHLRELVHTAVPRVTETIKWSMPHFEYAGALLCGMAAFKAHCTFGFWHQGMERLTRAAGARQEVAMGSFGRITRLEDLPPDRPMLRLIREAAKLNESGTPGRPRAATKSVRKELEIPPELTAALKKNTRAAKTFDAFSPSHRKEYVQWITEAKRDETRRQRLATTLEWLADGKPRHWKYLNC